MKKQLLSLSAICLTFFAFSQQLPNNGFELWQAGNPSNWASYDQVLSGLGIPGTTLESQVSPGSSGASACQLKTQSVPFVGDLSGIVTNGSLTWNGTSIDILGSPYTQNPVGYTFFYKYAPVNSDTAFTQVFFTKWNTVSNSRDTIGYGADIFTAAQSTFLQASLVIGWLPLSGAPDSVSMFFGSSAGAPQVNTTFIVDDVNMTFPLGVSESFMFNTFVSFPNPATTEFNLTAKDEKAAIVKFYDITGRLVGKTNFTDKKATINTSQFENGIYMYTILDTDNTELKTGKFEVSK